VDGLFGFGTIASTSPTAILCHQAVGTVKASIFILRGRTVVIPVARGTPKINQIGIDSGVGSCQTFIGVPGFTDDLVAEKRFDPKHGGSMYSTSRRP